MMFEENFAQGSTVIHRLDPRVKWISALLFSSVVAVSDRIEAALAGLALAACMAALARLNPAALARRLAAACSFLVLIWAVTPFAAGSEPAGSFLGLTAYREGVMLSLLVTVKSCAIVIAITALPGTSGIFDGIHALHHLRVPGKMAAVLFFAFRYVHVIGGEFARLRNAMRIRAFRPGTGIGTYRAYSWLLGTLFVRGFERSDRVHDAMLCRGWKGTFYTLHHFRFRPADAAALAILSAAAAAVAAIELA